MKHDEVKNKFITLICHILYISDSDSKAEYLKRFVGGFTINLPLKSFNKIFLDFYHFFVGKLL